MMITLNQIIRSRAGFVTAAAALMLNLSLAHAVAFNPNVVITGSTDFDESFSLGASGDFKIVSGGVATTSTYDAASAVAPIGGNPLAGTLTDIGDGFGFTGTASATATLDDIGDPNDPFDDVYIEELFTIGFDTAINVINNTSVMQTVVFRLSFSNMVNADDTADFDNTGITDAYAHSNFFLFDDISIGDIFFSDLSSDTLNGDENGGNLIDPATYGATLTESGDVLFSYMINPSDEVNLFMSWTLEGGDYVGGLAEADLNAFLSVDRVVPLPGSLWLMLSGMLVLLQRAVRR